MYNPAIVAVRLSTLLLYHRIFPVVRLRTILWIIAGFSICYCIVQCSIVIFACRPIRAAWDINVKGTCIPVNIAFMGMGAFNALTDVIIVCLPMPLLWRLHVDKARKVQLCSIFLLGGL